MKAANALCKKTVNRTIDAQRKGINDPSKMRWSMAVEPRGKVTIDAEECKGCGLCVASCPAHCLEPAAELNASGVHPVQCNGHICTGCGICFYCCPEPGAITVYRLKPRTSPEKEGNHASTL